MNPGIGIRAKARESIVNILSFDVEDYFMVSAFSSLVEFDSWPSYESRLARNTDLVLEILAEFQVRATFFVVGWVGEKYPEVVRKIIKEGHEIGCHGYRHTLVYGMEPDEFREDVRKAKEILQDAAGVPVFGYRAPSFSIAKRSMWALDILVEEGFLYDSSIFPVRHDRYGYPEFSRFPVAVETGSGEIFEIPPSTLCFLGQNVPFGGGGYFRIFPFRFTEWAIRALNEREGQPAVVYLHPWELDPLQPRIPCSRLTRHRHYRNLDKTEQRLRSLLRSHRFSSVEDVYGLRIAHA